MKSNIQTIKEFLLLPYEALPGAFWAEASVEKDLGSPWPYLHDAVLLAEKQQFNHFGLQIRISADRDEWRDGVIVAV
jgi:hypothetical protein